MDSRVASNNTASPVVDGEVQSPTAASPLLSAAAANYMLGGSPTSPTAATPLFDSSTPSPTRSPGTPEDSSPADTRPSTAALGESRPPTGDETELAYTTSPSASPEPLPRPPQPASLPPPSSSPLRGQLRPAQPPVDAGTSSLRRQSQHAPFMLAQHRLSRASSIGSDSRYPVPMSPSYEFGAMMGGAGSRNSTYNSTPRHSMYGANGSTSRPQSFIGRVESGYFTTPPPPSQSPSSQMVSSPLAIDARSGPSVAFPASQSAPLDPPVAPGLRSERASSEASTPTSASPLYRQSAAISNPSLVFAPYISYSNAPEPDDELHAPEKYDLKSGRPSKGPMLWSYRGLVNVLTLFVATVGIIALFVVYPITNHLDYAARISRMEGLGLALPHFNASGQLDLGGLQDAAQSSSRTTTVLPTTTTETTSSASASSTPGQTIDLGGTGTGTGTGTDPNAGTTDGTTTPGDTTATTPGGTTTEDGTTTDNGSTTNPDGTTTDGTTTGDDTTGTVPRRFVRR